MQLFCFPNIKISIQYRKKQCVNVHYLRAVHVQIASKYFVFIPAGRHSLFFDERIETFLQNWFHPENNRITIHHSQFTIH